jgi:hypothetical protein
MIRRPLAASTHLGWGSRSTRRSPSSRTAESGWRSSTRWRLEGRAEDLREAAVSPALPEVELEQAVAGGERGLVLDVEGAQPAMAGERQRPAARAATG